LALNVILTLIFGVLNVWAIHLLTVFAENQIRAKRLKHYTYEEVVQVRPKNMRGMINISQF